MRLGGLFCIMDLFGVLLLGIPGVSGAGGAGALCVRLGQEAGEGLIPSKKEVLIYSAGLVPEDGEQSKQQEAGEGLASNHRKEQK